MNIEEHFRRPRNRRALAEADGTGSAGDEGCGAQITVYLRFDGEEIAEAGYQATGSRAVVAAGSLLTEAITGRSWQQAAALPAAWLEQELGEDDAAERRPGEAPPRDGEATGPPGEDRVAQAADFTIEALHAALEDALRRDRLPTADGIDPDAVVVAMSGGVDSAVACMLLARSGRRVLGLTMRLWSDPGATPRDGASTCCSPQAVRDARAVCHRLGLPHLTVDLELPFARLVVEDFVAGYRRGWTPNPCTRCNAVFRFPRLVELAERLGAATVATGHYVRLRTRDGGLVITRGRDRDKDQSYMLWGVPPELLPRLEFPLGEMTKQETRQLAREAGLPVAGRPESQEICFVPGDDYRGFVAGRLEQAGEEPPGEGKIVDLEGEVIGEHRGYIGYTVGQRRGLGGGAREPLYVVAVRPEDNVIVAGPRSALAVRRLELESVNAFGELEQGETYGVQVRYRSGVVRGRVAAGAGAAGPGPGRPGSAPAGGPAGAGRLQVVLGEPAYGVAPGQSAVLYDGEQVVAGGVIAKTD